MEKIDYMDPTCPFDVSEYSKKKTIGPSVIDVKIILEKADKLYAMQEYDRAKKMLEDALIQARSFDDKAGELGILSELIGSYRKSGEVDKGIESVNRAFSLIDELGIEGTASAGTIWLNGATTLREFGRYDEALPYFYMASRAYSNTIAPNDYRFASLYNNMASCLEAMGRYDEALKHYLVALSAVKDNDLTLIEAAITYVNLAELYDKYDPESDKIEKCVKKCMEIFADDRVEKDEYYSYHAKSCAKGLDALGYFKDAKELRRRAAEVDEKIS